MNGQLDSLMRRMDHQFADSRLLTIALTHRSKGADNYERLEFLGDSILGFVVAEWLYHRFPELAEGKLSRMRASLVRKETLAKVARDLQLSQFLILGEGEMKSGGFNRDSILADGVESLIGALYLDAGFDAAREFVNQQFGPHFEAISSVGSFKDAKSRLQEKMQKKGWALPVYQIVDVGGEPHQQKFTVRCELLDLDMQHVTTAMSRRTAEQQAAAALLEQLERQEKGNGAAGADSAESGNDE